MRIATHNAYWVQGYPSLWGEEQAQTHPRMLPVAVSCYRQLSADILCLQEIPTKDTARALATELGMDWQFVAGGGRPDYGGAILWRDRSASAADLPHPDGDTRFERFCLRLHLGSLRIVNVHLSSNRYAPEGNGEPVRLRELDQVFEGGRPDIIAGDLNARSGSGVHRALADRGYREIGTPVCEPIPTEQRRVDGIWLHDDSPLRAQAPDIELIDAGLGDDRTLSDHPIVTSTVELETP